LIAWRVPRQPKDLLRDTAAETLFLAIKQPG
jgi:hypothetical protein